MIKYILLGVSNKDSDNIQSIYIQDNSWKCLGSYSDESEAMDLILKENPSILFINVDIIKKPFEYITECNKYLNSPITTIIISKNKQQAYNAIKNNAFDYILSPLSSLDIRKSMLKFQKRYNSIISNQICLKSYNDYRYISLDDIILLKADNNTTDFYLTNGTVITAFKTLKKFEVKLPNNFLRVHRSYIVNERFINRVNFGKNIFSLEHLESQIPFTKTYWGNVQHIKNTLEQKASFELN